MKNRRRPQNKRRQRTTNTRDVVTFPQVQGKTIETVELITRGDYRSISLRFADKTSLQFEIKAGFVVKTDLSDWKTGDQRVMKRWPVIRSGLA